MIPLQEQYTITINQQFDAIDKQLNPQFLATKQSGLSENTLRSNKKLLQVTDLNTIRELPQPNINQSLLTTDLNDSTMSIGVTDISKFNTAGGYAMINGEILQYAQIINNSTFEKKKFSLHG